MMRPWWEKRLTENGPQWFINFLIMMAIILLAIILYFGFRQLYKDMKDLEEGKEKGKINKLYRGPRRIM